MNKYYEMRTRHIEEVAASPRMFPFDIFNRHNEEIKEAISNDKTGEDFILEMFLCELANHEYCVTENLTDTLESLNLTIEEVNASETMKHGLELAISKYMDVRK